MPASSRACRTCKQRRVKCDEVRPVCNRCKKANLVCHSAEERKVTFLNENDYAVGRRKRPRGPHTKAVQVAIIRNAINLTPAPPKESAKDSSPSSALISLRTPPTSPQEDSISISPTLSSSLKDQALTYYSRCYIEQPSNLPEFADGHLSHVLVESCYSAPQSVLSLAISSVSHATFGRALRSDAALAVGRAQYSRALSHTNTALADSSAATNDEVLLAVMLLSFYENSVKDRAGGKTAVTTAESGIQKLAAQSFAHHDGAMAMLSLRRQVSRRSKGSLELDKLVRRQLLRSLLLRSLPPPPWLRDGGQFGEVGLALGLDRLMVETATLRHEADRLFAHSTSLAAPATYEVASFRRLMVKAHMLDEDLVIWANDRAAEKAYSIRIVLFNPLSGSNEKIFDGSVHVYPTVGHAGMWNRYRVLRLGLHDIILKTLAVLARSPDFDTESLQEAARSKIRCVADEFCASIPYALGLLKPLTVAGQEVVVTNEPASLKVAVNGATASFLCWPLAMATTISAIPDRHQRYLKDRLLDVSILADDGVLERLAAGSPANLDEFTIQSI